MKAEIEKSSVVKVIDEITSERLLMELDNLPTVAEDRTSSVVLNSLTTPNAILGFRRLGSDRWFINALCFNPVVEPISNDLTTIQVWTLVEAFFYDRDWIQLMHSQ